MRPSALILVGALAGCAGTGTLDQPRRLDAPFVSAQRLGAQFVSPQAIARSTRRMADSADRLASAELQRTGNLAPTATRLAATEVQHAGNLSAAARAPAHEVQRLGPALASGRRMLQQLRADLISLRHELAKLPEITRLQRRLMAEPDDRNRRVDPDDDRPEASLWARIARRIFP